MPGSHVVDLRNSFGAIFIGLVISTMFAGLAIGQTWIYYWRFWNEDRKALKFFIGFLLFMTILDAISSAYAIYWYLVLNVGNLSNLGNNLWALEFQTLLCAIPGTAVQFYYAWRIYIVSQSIICPVIIVALVLFGDALLLYFSAKQFAVKQLSKLHVSTSLRLMGLATGVLADVLIAAMMCWALHRKKTGFARTDSVIMILMAYSINSGLLLSLLGTATLIVSLLLPHTMIYQGIFWVTCKCYINCLLAMLNSRDYIRDQSTTNNPVDTFNLSAIQFDSVIVHRSTASEFGTGSNPTAK